MLEERWQKVISAKLPDASELLATTQRIGQLADGFRTP
jgi:hypothetical protein